MVAVYNSCLVGKVIEVYPWYCKVGLITDSECKIAAFCAKTTTNGILEGLNKDDVMMLRYVSHLSQVMEGDVIVSSGQGLIFPAGFGLGTIIHIAKENLFYTIRVKPMIDLQSVQHCIIIAKEQIESGGI
jgi:rod shape-determining protein MreC